MSGPIMEVDHKPQIPHEVKADQSLPAGLREGWGSFPNLVEPKDTNTAPTSPVVKRCFTSRTGPEPQATSPQISTDQQTRLNLPRDKERQSLSPDFSSYAGVWRRREAGGMWENIALHTSLTGQEVPFQDNEKTVRGQSPSASRRRNIESMAGAVLPGLNLGNQEELLQLIELGRNGDEQATDNILDYLKGLSPNEGETTTIIEETEVLKETPDTPTPSPDDFSYLTPESPPLALADEADIDQVERKQLEREKEVSAIQVEGSTFEYRLKPGDNLFKVAKKFGISLRDLIELNPGVPLDNFNRWLGEVVIVSDIARDTRENLPQAIEALGDVPHVTLALPHPMSAKELVEKLGLKMSAEELIERNFLQAEIKDTLPAGVNLAIDIQNGMSLGVDGHVVHLPSGVELDELFWFDESGREIDIFQDERVPYLTQAFMKVPTQVVFWERKKWSSADKYFRKHLEGNQEGPVEFRNYRETGKDRVLDFFDQETGEWVDKVLPGKEIEGYRRYTRSCGDFLIPLSCWDGIPEKFTLKEIIKEHGQIELPLGVSPEERGFFKGQPISPPPTINRQA